MTNTNDIQRYVNTNENKPKYDRKLYAQYLTNYNNTGNDGLYD